MLSKNRRIFREAKTVEIMIEIYCQGHHGSIKELCPECTELKDYALKKLGSCQFQSGKTTCAKCPVHCYQKEKRERIRKVMRYAGPRMPARHPILSIYHYIDSRRKEPKKS